MSSSTVSRKRETSLNGQSVTLLRSRTSRSAYKLTIALMANPISQMLDESNLTP
jgi:hypothetical protein